MDALHPHNGIPPIKMSWTKQPLDLQQQGISVNCYIQDELKIKSFNFRPNGTCIFIIRSVSQPLGLDFVSTPVG